jgi:aspartyl-tRNA(Asn)/glutamyl-tRNA(Gln) amidotransferase subunit B
LIEDGGEVVQETRLYDSDKDETRSMRSKEEANDYRYFPDPDLLPVEIDEAYIEAVRGTLPELPDAKRHRLIEEYEIRTDDAGILTASRALADYFEETVAATEGKPQGVANFVIGGLSGALNRDGLAIEQSPVSAAALAGLLDRIKDNTISGKIAKEVFEAMWAGEGSADEVIEARGLKQITDSSAIESVVDQVIAANPGQVAEYKAGKDKLIGFFVGQVMKETGGKANPGQVNAILKQRLS